MGMRNITLWDSDDIEEHNIANQVFPVSSIGSNKAIAMRDSIISSTGATYDTNPHWKKEKLDGLVFSCVDNMETRKKILNSMKSGMFIEVRMGVYHGQIFSIRPANKGDKKFWRSHWVGDDVVEEKSACGTSLTIGATAQLLSAIASWQGIKYLREEELSRGLTMCVNPYHLEEF